MIRKDADPLALAGFAAQVTVVGGGPVGLLTALALARSGLRVLVLESGGERATPAASALSAAENLRPDNHFDPAIATARRLGGSGNLWTGRCLPLDPVDFAHRPWMPGGGLGPWPIGPGDLEPYLAPALEGLGAGAPVFRAPLPGVTAGDAFGWETLERWSMEPRTHVLQARALETTPGLLVALGVTVTGFAWDGAGSGTGSGPVRVSGVEVHCAGAGGLRGRLPVTALLLAAGGNESTRLLLGEQRRYPGLFGGRDGPLGRYYMGHLAGEIADIVFDDAILHDGMAFRREAGGSYVRRRLTPSPGTQEAARAGNAAFWPVVPRLADPAHRSGPLSLAFLALNCPPLARRLLAEPIRVKHLGPGPVDWAAHLGNVAADLPRGLRFAAAALWHRGVFRRRPPGFFLVNRARRYRLSYHAEQLPDPDSRLTLSERTDPLGMPQLRIDLRFSREDAEGVVRLHDAMQAWLARSGLARLEYHQAERAARVAAVLALARDGAHQIGTIRMGADPGRSVVGPDCRVHGVANLYVVSTAVLPTSGQANPTLTAVQLGLRLAADWPAAAALRAGSSAGLPNSRHLATGR